MNNLKLVETLEKAREVFFMALLDGYASKKKTIQRIEGLPNHKSTFFSSEGFSVTDFWFSVPGSNASSGTTLITHTTPNDIDRVIWQMSYGGWYDEEVIPFLKDALAVAYRAQEFFGGRGPRVYRGNKFTYYNNPTVKSFAHFSGREKIIANDTGELMRFHEYWGLSLLSESLK